MRNYKRKLTALAVAASLVFAGAQTVFAANTAAEESLLSWKLGAIKTAAEYIHEHYKDSVNYEQLMEGAMKGLLESLGDEYSLTYASEKEMSDFVDYVTNAGSDSVSVELMAGTTIGLIKISLFDEDSSAEFRTALAELREMGADRFIIDLRNNPGGFVEQAVEVADQLIRYGNIGTLSQQGSLVKTYKATVAEAMDEPYVLLVNGTTASASEIVASAVKYNGLAEIVGTTTFGKGVAQHVITLDTGERFKLSEYYFRGPMGEELNEVGVVPDHVVLNAAENADEMIEKYKAFAPLKETSKPKAGESDLNVYAAQQRLALLGYDVELTGVMDAKTIAAVKKFQQRAGLYPYAVIDYSTMRAIEKELSAQMYGNPDDDRQLAKAMELLV